MTEAELSTLEQAARTADELDRLQLAVRKLSELTSSGSTGQIQAHPLLAAVDRHRRLLERLTAALNLPDDDQQVGLRAGSRHARHAVTERWKKARQQDGNPPTTASTDSAS